MYQLRRSIQQGIRWGILWSAVILAGIFNFVEGLIRGTARRPRRQEGTTGGRPMGASPIIGWWARGSIWLTSRIRRWLGRYVQSRHPRIYQTFRKFFT